MSASSSPFNRCSISDSVLGVSTRTRDVNASSSRSCAGGLSAGENAAGNLATAISASLWDENFCSVSMNTTPDSSPPHDLGAAHAHASVRHICVFPAPAGPTSSLIDPVGTPPPSALSSASRCARTYAGVFFVLTEDPAPDVDAPPPSFIVDASRPVGGSVDSSVGSSVLDASSCAAVTGRGQHARATHATIFSATGRLTSSISTRSNGCLVRTSSQVRKFWDSRRLRMSTSRPATRASERFAAMPTPRACEAATTATTKFHSFIGRTDGLAKLRWVPKGGNKWGKVDEALRGRRVRWRDERSGVDTAAGQPRAGKEKAAPRRRAKPGRGGGSPDAHPGVTSLLTVRERPASFPPVPWRTFRGARPPRWAAPAT